MELFFGRFPVPDLYVALKPTSVIDASLCITSSSSFPEVLTRDGSSLPQYLPRMVVAFSSPPS